MSVLQYEPGILREYDNLLQPDSFYDITRERWEGILQYRKKFFESDNNVPPCDEHMNPEIVATWVHAREMGVSPYKKPSQKVLSQDEYGRILEEENNITDGAKPFYNALAQVAFAFNGEMTLNNRNGVALFVCGRQVYGEKQSNLRVPTLNWGVLDEDNVGNSAFSLCKQLRRPVQLLGPEHYNETMASANLIASAAPILDQNSEVIASINFVQPLVNPPWDKYFQCMSMQVLSVITALALSVQNMIIADKHITNMQRHLQTTEAILDTILYVTNEILITVDLAGRIIGLNQEGCRILNLDKKDAVGKNIGEFLNRQSRLMNHIAAGDQIDIEEKINIGNHEMDYFINIRPVFNSSDGNIVMILLKFVPSEKNYCRNTKPGINTKYTLDDIIGESSEIKLVKNKIKMIAEFQENVLLTGESGTGKELFAQAIHNLHNTQGPFIAINCAAIPTNLIESELFGYEGGSFTGADRNGKPGKFELAQGGTLFLDEIGDMPIELQATLLRILEDKQVMRIGGRRAKSIEFRVIAATNKDLFQLVKEKLFREDLFFRLSIFSFNIPSLRQRGDDLELLSRYFINNYCRKFGRGIPRISPSALKIIKDYDWPGNVRQLGNAIIYAINFAENKVITPESLPDYILRDRDLTVAQTEKAALNYSLESSLQVNKLPSLKDSEKSLLENAFKAAKYDVTLAAYMVGISKTTMYRKLREYGIK